MTLDALREDLTSGALGSPPEPAPEMSSGPPRAAVAIRAARAKLNAPPKLEPIWPVLGAAALAAASALTLATAVIVGLPRISDAPQASPFGGKVPPHKVAAVN
jgi:hypothetical protein